MNWYRRGQFQVVTLSKVLYDYCLIHVPNVSHVTSDHDTWPE